MKHASVTRLQTRIDAREQAKFRAKLQRHDCVLERRAISDDVAITFQNASEQHRLHLAFGEDWCDACSACDQLRANGSEPTKLGLSEIAGMRRHWACIVTFARLFELPHVKAGCEALAPYQCTRGVDADSTLYMKPGLAVSAEDAARLVALGWRVVDDGTWCAGMEAT